MAIYVLDISVFQFSKISAIVVSRSPGDTVTLESLESRCGISSSYDSLKNNHFSHSPKSDVIDDAAVIRAVACGSICY